MATRREREVLRQAAEDGDALASAALGDDLQADGLPPVPRFGRGDWVVIFTGAFFHCGQLLGEDHEYYSLAPGSAQIFETGEFATFFGKGLAGACETIPVACLVRKGPATHLVGWPFDRPCRIAGEEV